MDFRFYSTGENMSNALPYFPVEKEISRHSAVIVIAVFADDSSESRHPFGQ